VRTLEETERNQILKSFLTPYGASRERTGRSNPGSTEYLKSEDA